MTTSLQGHQKQIRRCSKWLREIVSGNSRGQSADLSGGEAGRRRRAIELIQIYIVENSIWPSRSSNRFRFTRHQSNLFVGAHQDVKPGLTYCNTNPICPFSGTRANRGVRPSGSSPTPPRLNDKINTHTSGLPFITHTHTRSVLASLIGLCGITQDAFSKHLFGDVYYCIQITMLLLMPQLQLLLLLDPTAL